LIDAGMLELEAMGGARFIAPRSGAAVGGLCRAPACGWNSKVNFTSDISSPGL